MKDHKQILQIDVKEAKNPSEFEDLVDVIIAEARKDEKKYPGKQLKSN